LSGDRALRSLLVSTLLLYQVLHSPTLGLRTVEAFLRDRPPNPTELLKRSESENLTNHPLALATARDALALLQAANDRAGMARAYAQIGECQLAQNDLTEASASYEQALQLWQELNDSVEEAEVLISLGFVEN